MSISSIASAMENVLYWHSTKNERELSLEILALQTLINANQTKLMATIADLTASVAALTTQVAAIPQAGTGTTTGISEADLDPIKSGIDQATANIAAKLIVTPTP